MSINWDKVLIDGEQVNERIVYWTDIWSEISSEIEEGYIGTKIINAHIIVKDIIMECNFNKMRNYENRIFFIRKIEEFMSLNSIIKEFYFSDFKILKEALETENIKYISILCKDIDNKFTKDSYITMIFDSLKDILLRENKNEKDFPIIKQLSLELIIELILLGHDIKKIKKYVYNTFSSYAVLIHEGKELYVIDFENHNIKYNDFMDLKHFQEKCIDVIDNLTLKDRIKSFIGYIDKKKEKGYYFFRVSGIRIATTNNISIRNCVLYDPNRYRFLDKNNLEEFFDIPFDENYHGFFNIKVEIDSIDAIAGKRQALESAEKCIEFLIFKFNLNNKQVFLETDTYFSTDKDYRIETQGYGIGNKSERWKKIAENSPVFIKDKNMEEGLSEYTNILNTLYLDSNNKLKRILDSAFSFYSKAELAHKEEEKLLYYWICMENLIDIKSDEPNLLIGKKEKETTFVLSKITLSNILVLNYITSVIKNMVNTARHYNTYMVKKFSEKGVFELPQDKINELNLFSNVDLLEFKDSLNGLKNYTESHYLIEIIEFAQKFYKDNSFALRELQKKQKEAQEEILYIYKMRNQIVHNGYVEKNILPHIVISAKRYASLLMYYIMNDLISENEDMEETFIQLDKKVKYLFLELNRSKEIDMLEMYYDELL